jgi:hypothetical protein
MFASFSIRNQLIALLLIGGLAGCNRLIAPKDQPTISKTMALKTTTLELMNHATEPYEKYEKNAKNILATADSIYQRQKTFKANDLSIKQWQLMLEDMTIQGITSKGILTGFFTSWQNASVTKKPLGQFFIDEKKKKIGDGFDEILRLENAKKPAN